MPFNSLFAWIIKRRINHLDYFINNPVEIQEAVLNHLLESGKKTQFGSEHHMNTVSDYLSFSQKIPLSNYSDLEPYIQKEMQGIRNVLWPGKTKWFVKTSGTTSPFKYIPVTKESLLNCHYKGGKDLLSLYYNQLPKRKLYNAKHLILGGSAKLNPLGNNLFMGDLSAIIIDNLPLWAELRRTPSKKTALLSDWEEKLEKMALESINKNVCILAGVPSWTLKLCHKVLEISGKDNLREVWPNLELFMHGGINFSPYKASFDKIITGPMNYFETYNASEGFIGLQYQLNKPDLLLLLDYGIFYEFIPTNNYEGTKSSIIIDLKNVKVGVDYAIVLTTNSGLWRYILGDTIQFTNTNPFTFKITGRVESYLNSVGEKLTVCQAEEAITYACQKTDCTLRDFTVGPFLNDEEVFTKHQWFIEFNTGPHSIENFTLFLDEKLQELNSDYKVKRFNNLLLSEPLLKIVPENTFEKWLSSKNKVGGQHKVPRLSSNRIILNEINDLL